MAFKAKVIYNVSRFSMIKYLFRGMVSGLTEKISVLKLYEGKLNHVIIIVWDEISMINKYQIAAVE